MYERVPSSKFILPEGYGLWSKGEEVIFTIGCVWSGVRVGGILVYPFSGISHSHSQIPSHISHPALSPRPFPQPPDLLGDPTPVEDISHGYFHPLGDFVSGVCCFVFGRGFGLDWIGLLECVGGKGGKGEGRRVSCTLHDRLLFEMKQGEMGEDGTERRGRGRQGKAGYHLVF